MSDLYKSFDDWFYSKYLTSLDDFNGFDIKDAFQAGQQSMQKEIDLLQDRIDELKLTIKRLITSEEDIARSCAHWRDSHRELDERITKALNTSDEFYSFGDGESCMAFCNEIVNILRGR